MNNLFKTFCFIIAIFNFSKYFAAPLDLTCQSNNLNNISCKSTLSSNQIITEIYAIDNCSSTNLKSTSDINAFCIGQNRCNISSISKSHYFKYQCTDISQIFSRDKGSFGITLESLFYLTSSKSVNSIPLLPNVSTITYCYLSNIYQSNLSIEVFIPVLNFTMNYQMLEIFVSEDRRNQSIRYSKNNMQANRRITFKLQMNWNLIVVYAFNGSSQQGNTGSLLVRFNWDSLLLVTCDLSSPPGWTPLFEMPSTTAKPNNFTFTTIDSSNNTIYRQTERYINFSPGEIAGIVIGAIVFLVIVITIPCLVIFFRRKNKTKSDPSNTEISLPKTKVADQNFEYEVYSPSPAHLEGSDVSGSFVFEKNVEASTIKTKDEKPKKKKIPPKLIQSNSNVVSYSTVHPGAKDRRRNVANDKDRTLVLSRNDSSHIYESSTEDVSLDENRLYAKINTIYSTDDVMLEENRI